MIGRYHFCGHYEWTFSWIESNGGRGLLKTYWEEAIGEDSQRHARSLIIPQGLDGMKRYWQHTLEEEAAGYALTSDEKCLRIDIKTCPSKGFLLKNGLQQHSDYCDDCMGWIGPMMKASGYVVDHQHNHQGRSWREFRKKHDGNGSSDPEELVTDKDVRLKPGWESGPIDSFKRATDADDKS